MADLDSLMMDLGGAPAMARPSSGWSALGRAVAGNGISNQMAYNTGVLGGARQASALELARERRDKNLALQSITPEAMADPSQRGALTAAMLRAGINPNNLAESEATTQKTGFQNQAWQNAVGANPDLNLMNRELAVIHGQPVDLSSIQGNTLMSKFVTPDEQAALGGNVPTAIGQSEIAKAMAGAGAENARAAASYASAARQRAGIGADKAANYELLPDEQGNLIRVNKLTGQSAAITDEGGAPIHAAPKGGAGGGGKTIPGPATLKQVFGEPKVGGQPNEQTQDFLSWQALQAQDDPRYNNGEYALQQYLLKASGGQHAENATASDAEALGLSNAVQNRANATGRPQKDETGNAVVPLATTSAIGKAMTASKPGAASAPSAPADDGMAAPTTQAEYDKLPQGTPYRDPNGVVRIKGGG